MSNRAKETLRLLRNGQLPPLDLDDNAPSPNDIKNCLHDTPYEEPFGLRYIGDHKKKSNKKQFGLKEKHII